MATRGNNGNKPDLSDLKARLGLSPTAKPGAQGPPAGAQAPPGAQRPPQAAQSGPPAGAQAPQMQQPVAMQQPPQQQYASPQQQQPYDAPTANLSPLDAAQLQQQSNPQQQQYAAAQPQYQSSPEPSTSDYRQAAAPAQQPARLGPPPGAKRPKAKRDLSSLPVQDVQIDEKVAQRATFSPAVIGLLVGMLVLGLVFGFMYAQSSQARALYENQTAAAQELHEMLKPKVEESKKVVALINKMDSTKPQFDLTTQLNEIDFVPGPGTITSKTVFLGGSIVYDTTTFMSKATTLKQLIRRHDDLTTADKEEIEKLVQGNELLQGNDQIAIIYNHKALIEFVEKKKDAKSYRPTNGKLVTFSKFEPNDKGDVEYNILNSNSKGEWSALGVIPIDKTDALKTAGQGNALQRYKRRVDVLKRYALDLNKHVSGVLEPVEAVATRGGAPLLQMSAPDAPAPAAPSESEAPAAPPKTEAPAAPAAEPKK